jgi:hypothetical protein
MHEGGLSDRCTHLPALIFQLRRCQAWVLQVDVGKSCRGAIAEGQRGASVALIALVRREGETLSLLTICG